MSNGLDWARGPMFRMALIIMILGLVRILILNGLHLFRLVRQARMHGRRIDWKAISIQTGTWLFPVKAVFRGKPFFNGISIAFHASIITVPLFLQAHVALWERSLGVRWPVLPGQMADILTLTALGTCVALLIQRTVFRASRQLSRPSDYLFLILILIPFASGYASMHPWVNPIPFEAMLLVHICSANMIMVLVPFTKISHVVLFPLTQMVSELGWYLKPNSGHQVAIALNKQEEPL